MKSEIDGFTFFTLHPTELPQFFHMIEPGLMEIQRRSKISWDIMVLPTLIESNRATLTMIHYGEEGRLAGFVITQSVFRGMPNKHYLQVVAPYVELWCHKEGLDGVAAIDKFVSEFGRSLGCKAILETATREGWVRRLSKLGYESVENTMIKEL